MNEHELAIIARINDARAARGIAPLTPDTRIAAASRGHAEDMAAHPGMVHIGSDGSDGGERIRRAALRGVDEGPADAHTVAELVTLTGATDYNVRKALMRLKLAGRLEVCHVKRRRLDDRAVMTAAYRWKAAGNPVEFDGIRP